MPVTNLDFRVVPASLVAESLDLAADTTCQLEINSPLFDTDTLPGALIYPFTVPDTPKNRRLLAFAGYLAAAPVRNQLFVCDLYLLGVRWRRGKLSVVSRSSAGFELSFKTDVGDVATALTDVQLRALALPTVPLVLSAGGSGWPAHAYALPTVANSLFIPAASVTALGYRGLVNAYQGGAYDTSQPLVPMVYLRTVLEQVGGLIGYSLAGSFFADAELQRLVLYANQAVDVAAGQVALAGQLPDASVPQLLLAVRALLGQCLVFDSVRQVLEVDALRDVLASPDFVDWTDRAEAAYKWEPNTSAGFLLSQQLDSSDDLSKNASVADYELKVGGAQEKIEVQAGTLSMQRGPATPTSATSALLPVAVQKGNSPALPEEKDNQVSLRLLFDRGLHLDGAGQAYPLASAEAVDYAGASAGQYSLRWGGPQGLYATWHQDWLAFRSRTELVTRGVRLRLADLLTLDPRRKVLIRAAEGTTLAFWQQIQVSISQQDGLQVATIPFYKI